MKVKLAEGRLLRDPDTKQLINPGDVRDVPDTSLYWRRRLRDGDVVMVGDPPGGTLHHHRRAKED